MSQQVGLWDGRARESQGGHLACDILVLFLWAGVGSFEGCSDLKE